MLMLVFVLFGRRRSLCRRCDILVLPLEEGPERARVMILWDGGLDEDIEGVGWVVEGRGPKHK